VTDDLKHTVVGRRERVLTLAWSGLENIFRQILSLAFFFVSVRFLHPRDLGLFSLALAFMGIAAVFIDDPVGESLLQKVNATTIDWDTGFTVNLMISTGLTAASALASWPLASYLNEPALHFAVPALASSFLVGSLGNIQKAYLGRMLRFRSIAQTTFVAQIGAGLVTVTLAILGFGYWALIANVWVSTLINTAICWYISPWKPRLRIDPAAIASRRPYAIYSAAIRSVYLVRDQSPLMLCGLFLDLTQVGYFSLALRVARTAGQMFEDVTGRPLLSLMSREQHDMERFGQALVELLTIVGLFAIPGFVGLGIVGPILIPLAFGAAWSPAGAYLPWICIVLSGWLLLHVVLGSLRARNMSRLAVQLTIPAALCDAILLASLIPFGIRVALIAWASRAVLALPVVIHVLHRHLGVPFRLLAQRLVAPLLASAIMALVLVTSADLQLSASGLANVGISIALGCVTYGVVVFATMPALRGQLLARLATSRP
jgi:O-antigen/teichoic acid export membrane protein